MADTPITYAADAYTPERAQQPRSEECRHSRRFRLAAASGQRLPRRQPTVDMAPTTRGIRLVPPQELRKIESQSYYRVRPEDRPTHPVRMDEECLRYTSQTKRDFFFGVIRALGFIGLVWMTPLAILGITAMAASFAANARYGGFLSNFFGYSGWSILLFLALPALIMWGGAHLIYRLFPNWTSGYQPGPMWELNRATGKVVVFANPGKSSTAWQVAHELPFEEFDCYLQSTPSHQGLPQFNLSLVHYREEAHVALVGMFSATSSHVEQRAAWDMIQRYMDTSQPLPDIPVFEIYRSLDPATIEHDRRTRRNPRFWRDMDDATYERHVSEHQDKLNAFYRG
ncbi:hypothetical protein ACUY1T_07950 [Billgrantia sp. Q4P2]|uniref:hypothetical protein n=1 Tax=Billgrantia sp. Q4P2 TaxID=3463857 RepID=UPI004056D25A